LTTNPVKIATKTANIRVRLPPSMPLAADKGIALIDNKKTIKKQVPKK
jgi:hypothetical protein